MSPTHLRLAWLSSFDVEKEGSGGKG